MSWLNSSLNTIKGQLTTLAQEVLAETAGPGDDDYRGPEVNKKTALELLAQTQQEKDEFEKQCNEKEHLIAALRQQIVDLQSKISDSGGGNSSKSTEANYGKSQNIHDSNVEDSWCWEPDNTKAIQDEKDKFQTIPLGQSTSNGQLQERVLALETENKHLNEALEDLDSQHNVAMQNIIDMKTSLQEKLNQMTIENKELNEKYQLEHSQNLIEVSKLKEDIDSLLSLKKESVDLKRQTERYEEEMIQATKEMANLQVLLEKKNNDNVELIDRIKSLSNETDILAEEKTLLMQKMESLLQEMENAKKLKEKKNSESSNSSASKQSDDEFIVVRESDANSSGPTTPPTKEILKDKLVELENRVSELTLENGSLALKLQDNEKEKDLLCEALKENLSDLQKKCEKYEVDLSMIQSDLMDERENMKEMREKASEAIILEEQLKALKEESKVLNEQQLEQERTLKLVGELEQRLVISEQEKESLQVQVESLRETKDKALELEERIQKLTVENQRLQLNAEAEIESMKNSNEMEEKFKSLSEENETLIAELAEAKYTRSLLAQKQEVTDLDADEDDSINLEKLENLLSVFLKKDFIIDTEEGLKKTSKVLFDRLDKINGLEKDLRQMSNEIMDLQDSKMEWDHEKKTLEADISQYIIQCDELMKNNGILLNELENLKRNKLESIPETNEDNILQLESQLEECSKLNRTLECEYAELHEKVDELDREKQDLTETLRETQYQNEHFKRHSEELQMQIDALELEKSNLLFELNEIKSGSEKEHEAELELQNCQEKIKDLESQLARLSQDHSDLVNSMLAQKNSFQEANTKRLDLEKKYDLQVKKLNELNEQLSIQVNISEAFTKDIKSLKQELLAKDIITQSLNSEINSLKTQMEDFEELKLIRENLTEQLNENIALVATLQNELDERSSAEQNLQVELQKLTHENSNNFNEELKQLRSANEALEIAHKDLQENYEKQWSELNELRKNLSSESLEKIVKSDSETYEISELQKSIEILTFEKNEMIKVLQQKHNENTQYYAEIQRLNPIIQQLQLQLQELSSKPIIETPTCLRCAGLESNIKEIEVEVEKSKDQINFLKEKSDILTTNLLTEQTNQKLLQEEKAEILEHNANIRKELERLRAHLLEVEDMHTKELVEMQTELEDTKSKMLSLETEVSKSSSAFTSASIRANQHAETLQAQYSLIVQQRDELLAKLSLAEDRESKNQAALCNLQCALEQFQNDKDHEIEVATQRIRKELKHELEKETELQKEVANLNQQLNEANQGLLAAARLSDQLESSQQTILVLRDEVDSLKQNNNQLEEKLKSSELSQSDKIDKNLIKSLIIGYVVSANPNDKNQVLRMISSVLEFTHNDSDKVGLNKQQSSWLGSILGGSNNNSGGQSKDNLIQAFVQFLEQESQPKNSNLPNLLNMSHSTYPSNNSRTRTTSASGHSNDYAPSGSPTPIHPISLNSNILEDFTPSRNSSSILKDILSDS